MKFLHKSIKYFLRLHTLDYRRYRVPSNKVEVGGISQLIDNGRPECDV